MQSMLQGGGYYPLRCPLELGLSSRAFSATGSYPAYFGVNDDIVYGVLYDVSYLSEFILDIYLDKFFR